MTALNLKPKGQWWDTKAAHFNYMMATRLERDRRVAWLRKKGKTPATQALAEKMESCHPVERCGSGACPICGVKAQVGLAKAIDSLSSKSKGQVFTVTIVPASSAVPVGQLNSLDYANHVRRLKRVLKDSSMEWLIGGTDFSLNEHKDGRYPAFWAPHLYGIGVAPNLDDIRSAIKPLFPASAAIPRPLKLIPWDGRRNALLYALKIDFCRRVGVDDVCRFNKQTGEQRLCRATQKQRLRSAEKLELLLYLDALGISRRTFSQRCQVHHHGRRYTVRLTS